MKVDAEAVERTALPDETTGPPGPFLDFEDGRSLIKKAAEHEVLTREEEVELAQRIERGDLEAKERMFLSNVRLVLKISYGSSVPMPKGECIQFGCLGLIRATEKFDWRKGNKFSTYATNWIKAAIQRGHDDKHRPVRQPASYETEARKLNKTEGKLAGLFGRMPTIEEIAEAAEIDPDRAEMVLQATRTHVSLDANVGEDDGSFGLIDTVRDPRPDPAKVVEQDSLRELTKESVEKLPKWAREVIETLYYNGHDGDRRQAAKTLEVELEELIEMEEKALARLSESVTGSDPDSFGEFWEKARPATTDEELRETVRDLKDSQPDRGFPQIGEMLGISQRQAYTYYEQRHRATKADATR